MRCGCGIGGTAWAGALLILSAGLCWSDSLPEALSERRFGDALRLSDSLLESRPQDPRIWTARGVALENLGRDPESLSSFEKALSLDAHFVPALKGAAEVGYRIHDARTANFVDRLISLDPANGVAHAMAGVLAFEAGECGLAVSHFEKARAETAANERAYPLYGACLIRLQRPVDAIPIFERILGAHPGSAEACNSLAGAEAAAGRLESAIAHLRKAIEIAPDDERNYVDLAALCISHDGTECAATVLDFGLRQIPRSARLHALRGVVHGQLGKFEEAAAEFELANRLDPKQEYGAAGLGVLFTEENRIDLASALLRERLLRSPNDATLNYLFADALIHEDLDRDTPKFIEARDALIRAAGARPDFAKAHTLLGKLYNRAGDYSKAVDELRLGAQFDPSDRMALSQLAIALRQLGRTGEAAAALAGLRRLVMKDVDPPVQQR